MKRKRSSRRWVLLLAFGVSSGLAVWNWLPYSTEPELPPTAFYLVQRTNLLVSIIEEGALKAASEVIVRNQLEGVSRIITLAPEGAHVKKGDLLVELDSSELKDRINAQEVEHQDALLAYLRAEEGLKIQRSLVASQIKDAELQVEFAQSDLEKYRDGDAPQQLRNTEASISIQQEELRTAEERLARTEVLVNRGNATKTQWEADSVSTKRRRIQLEQSRENLRLMIKFDQPNMIRQLESNLQKAKDDLVRLKQRSAAEIAQVEADLKTSKSSLDVMEQALNRFKRQLEATKLLAPQDGLVVYASVNPFSSSGGFDPGRSRGSFGGSREGGSSRSFSSEGRSRGGERGSGSRGSSGFSSRGGSSGGSGSGGAASSFSQGPGSAAGTSSSGSAGGGSSFGGVSQSSTGSSGALGSNAGSSGSLSMSGGSFSGGSSSSFQPAGGGGSGRSMGGGSSGSRRSGSSGMRSGSSASSGMRSSAPSLASSGTSSGSATSSGAGVGGSSSIGGTGQSGSGGGGLASFGSSSSGLGGFGSSGLFEASPGSSYVSSSGSSSRSSSFSMEEGFFMSGSTVIEEGAQVRQRQELIKLPDVSQMLAEVKVHESRVRQVAPGMTAYVRVENLPGRRFKGVVRRVAVLPDSQTSWLSPDLKVYSTDVLIQDELPDLKPGVSARAQIIITNLSNVLVVPIQAVTRLKGKQVCYVQFDSNPTPLPVSVGWFNDQFIEVTSGLKPGDRVWLAPPPDTETPASGALLTDTNQTEISIEGGQPPSAPPTFDDAQRGPNESGERRNSPRAPQDGISDGPNGVSPEGAPGRGMRRSQGERGGNDPAGRGRSGQFMNLTPEEREARMKEFQERRNRRQSEPGGQSPGQGQAAPGQAPEP